MLVAQEKETILRVQMVLCTMERKNKGGRETNMVKFKEKFYTERDSVTTVDGVAYKKAEVNGKYFLVLTEKDPATYDVVAEGKIYIIELDGAIVIEAPTGEVEQ